MLFKRLDVGCGLRPTGDVNVDLFFREETEHVDAIGKKLVVAEGVRNPVKADAHFLPFRNEVFDEVYSHHVLEHIDDPSKALLEMLRVARYKVVFVVPHRFYRHQKRALKKDVHKHIFTTGSTKKWLSSLGINKYHIKTSYDSFPNKILRFIWLPSDMTVEIWK
jgi:ubiquinone/menaquinone biosynthesis C-methylase UbiE